MTYYFRSQWGARAPRGRYSFGGSDVEGIAIHWPAMSKRVRGVDAVKHFLRNVQNYHMDTNGWSDTGYQEAVDQDGNTYELRGLSHQSGANGNADVNDRFGALLLILAPNEEPTAAMMRAARARIARHRQLHPSSHRIVGHGQIRPGGTECPGPIAQRLINAGAFEPTQQEDEDMPLSDKDIDKIAYAVWAKEIGGGENRHPARKHLLWVSNSNRGRITRLLRKLAGKTDAEGN